MAKKKVFETANGDPAVSYRVTGPVVDKLRGQGHQELWTCKPKGHPFALACYLSPDRRMVVIQQYQNGNTNVFEEVTVDQLSEAA